MTTHAAPKGPTLTAEELRSGPHVTLDSVVALWAPALAVEIPLPMTTRFTVGRVGVDAEIPDESISRHHANVVRFGPALWWVDAGSKNGLDWAGLPVREVATRAGEVLKVGRVHVLGLTQPMAVALRELRFLLGYGAASIAGALLTEAARGRPCVLLGSPHSGRRESALALAKASPRRDRVVVLRAAALPLGPAQVRAWADDVAGGVACIDGADLAGMPADDAATLLRHLRDPERNAVVMAGFDDLESARYWLRDDFLLAQLAHVPPLTRRVAEGELPTMVDHLLAELGSAHRGAGIGKRTALQVTTMLRYPWPFDVAELRCWVRCLVAELDGVSVRQLADRYGVDHTTLHRQIKRWIAGQTPKRPTDEILRALLAR